MSTPPSKKMSSRKQKVTLEKHYLPDDVLWNIFMRLPAKLLAQMKSLCKSWNALISLPSFIKSHLHHSIHNNPEFLLVFIDGAFSYKEPLKFTVHSPRSPHIQLTNSIKPHPLVTNTHNPWFSRVIGSVNGLICFSTGTCGEYGIHIWNPSLSALIDIPPYTIPADSDDCEMLLRFGFDPKDDDYKVFVTAFCVGADGNMVTESLQVEVYSIRKGSWELISVRFPSHITFICNHSEVVVEGHDGRLHWICYAGNQATIVAFDLGVETFTEISLPDCIQFRSNSYVGVLSQKLCVISQSKNGNDDYAVWVMDTYGVAKSWVKKHVISLGDITPLGFTLSDDFIFEVDDDLALYDPNTAAVKLFKIRTMTGIKTRLIYQTIKVVPYVESLVWPVASSP